MLSQDIYCVIETFQSTAKPSLLHILSQCSIFDQAIDCNFVILFFRH